MVDASVIIRDYLLTRSEVTALLGTNANGSIYCAFDLPEHFDPTLGPAIQLFRAGGHSHAEITPLVDARVQIRAWADVEQYSAASALYGAINDVLHGLCGAAMPHGTILRALEVDGPLEFTDPETGWVAMYAFYQVLATPIAGPEAYVPQFSYGSGPPPALGNDEDVYEDAAGGYVYEQVAGQWIVIGNVPPASGTGGASITRYDNAETGGLTATSNPAVWTLAVPFTANAMCFRNGQLLSPTEQYTVSGSSITYAAAPAPTDDLAVVLVVSGSGGSGGSSEMPSTPYHLVALAGTNAANIKASPGTVTGWKVYNDTEYPIYVKLYDKATAPVPGTDTPKQTIGVDAGEGEVTNSAGFTYVNGIGIAITKGILDSDSTAVAAGDCSVDIFYQ
jgi:hypothetical protein